MKKLFDEIPRLESERIIIRRLEDSDTEALSELTGNSNVYRYLPTFLLEKKYDDLHQVIRELYEEPFLMKESLILGIYLKEEEKLCGLCEFYGLGDSIHKVSIGYRLAEEYWGRGIASETVKLMVDYLYGETDIQIITASTMIENKASAHVLEKNDFLRTASNVPEDWGFEQDTMADKWFL